MKRNGILLMGVLLLTLLSGCNREPDHSSADAFLKDFVETVKNSEEGRYTNFFIAATDFDKTSEGYEMALERFTGAVKAQFMRSCAGLAEYLRGKEVTVEKINYAEIRHRVTRFLKSVEEKFAGVEIHLEADDQLVILTIDELVKVKDKWRITTFTTLVDHGTEQREPVEMNVTGDQDDNEDSSGNDVGEEEIEEEG